MSGVLDEHGQWERCNQCGRYVLLEELQYGPIRPGLSPRWPGHTFLDLCSACIHPDHYEEVAR